MQKLGYILTEQGLLTDEQLGIALELQKMTGMKLGDLIVEKGILSDIQIMKALEIQSKIPYVDLTDVRADPKALSLINEEIAKKLCAIPIGFENDNLIVAINDPLDFILVDEIGYSTGKKILPRLSTRKQIMAAIETNFRLTASQPATHKSEHELKKKTHKPEIIDEPKQEPQREPLIVETIAIFKTAPPEVFVYPEPASPEIVALPDPAPPEIVAFPAPEPVAAVQDLVQDLAEPSIARIDMDRLSDQGGFMLDFTKTIKQHFPVNMPDNQAIRVRMPTNRAFAALIELQDKLSKLITLNANVAAQLDEIYGLCAKIMSNNLDLKEISNEYLSDLLDLEDLQIFAKKYTDFVNSVLNGARY